MVDNEIYSELLDRMIERNRKENRLYPGKGILGRVLHEFN